MSCERERIEQIVKHVTEAYGAKYTFSYEYGYRPVVNDYKVTEIIEQTALQLYGRERVTRLQPTMAGEDFQRFTKAPGTFFLSEQETKRKELYILTIILVLRLMKMHYQLACKSLYHRL